MINITDLSDDGIYDKIGQANVFYTKEYAEYITQSKSSKYIFLYSDKYVMPIVIYKKLCFRYANLVVEPFVYNSDSQVDLKSFLDDVVNFVSNKLKIQWVTPTFASALFTTYPMNSRRIPFGSHIIDLNKTEDELFAGLHSKHRNVIRKAQKDGVVVKNGHLNLIEDYITLDEATWQRSNRSGKGKEFYRNIINKLKDNCIVFIAYKNDEPQGGAIFLYNQAMSYYMFGASKNSPYTGAMNLLHWEAIKYMKSVGVNKYSFVGCRIDEDKDSKFHNIQRFKERFGGELIKGYMFKIVLNKFYYNLYRLLITIKSHHLFSKDPVDQEIPKWENLNNEKSV